MEFNNIGHDIGTVNPSGIGVEVYYIPKRHILEWPAITNDVMAALMIDGYVQYGDGENNSFTLAADQTWKRLYSTQGKGKINWDYLGETDCKVAVNKASLSFPKITNEARAFAKLANNGDFVFCIRHDGRFYIIGSPDYRAVVTTNGDSGDAPGSAKGMTVDVECQDTTPQPTYVGYLLLEDGYLDCETNTFINYSDMKTNYPKEYTVEDGNTVRFQALGQQGRIHLEGSGDIKLEVSVTGEENSYVEVEHDIAFENGLAVVPFDFIIGDYIQITATSLTKVIANYNNVNPAERN